MFVCFAFGLSVQSVEENASAVALYFSSRDDVAQNISDNGGELLLVRLVAVEIEYISVLLGDVNSQVRFVLEFTSDVNGAHVGAFLLVKKKDDVVVETCEGMTRMSNHFR